MISSVFPFPYKSRADIENMHEQWNKDPFRRAVGNASILSLADRNGIITYVNQNFSEISGYSADELMGKSHNIINSGYHPVDFWKSMWQTISSGKTWRGDVRNKRKDGSFYWVDTFIMPFSDDQGKIVEYISIRNDITDKKKAEESLIDKTSLVDNLLSGITDGFFALDADLNFTLVSQVAASMAQSSPEQMVGRNLIDVIPPEGYNHIAEEYRNAFRNQKSKIFNYRLTSDSQKIVQLFIYPNPGGLFIFFRDISHQKKIEEQLLEANQLFERLSENVPGIIFNFYINDEGQPVFPYLSDGALTLLGIHPLEMVNDANLFFNAVHPEDRETLWISFHTANTRLETWTGEFRMVLKDGTTKWVRGDSNPYFEKDGRHMWYGYLYDVTERKEAEMHIAEKETMYRLIFEHSGEGIIFTNADGNAISANSEACRIFGMDEPEICNSNRKFLITESELSQATLDPRNETGNFDGEVVMQRKNGSTFFAEITSRVFVHPNGETNSTVIIRDITEKKRAERELKKLALIAGKTSNAVILTDEKGRITWVNEGFERITEYKKDEVIGKKPGSILQGPETDQSTKKFLRDAIANNTGCKAEILNYSKTGKKYWLDIEIIPVYGEEDNIVTGFMAIESDITNLKNAFHEANRSRRTLDSFMHQAPMVAFMKDTQGKYTYFNTSYKEFMKDLQLEPGMTDFDIFNTDFAQDCRLRDEKVINEKEPIVFDHAVNGSFFLEYKFPLLDEKNEVFAVGGISIDISEKVKAQQLVVENEERLRSITDHLSEGVIFQGILDSDNSFISISYVSHGAFLLFEIPVESILTDPSLVLKLILQDDLEQFWETAWKAVKELTVFDHEYRIKTKSGQIKWVHTRCSPRKSKDDQTIWDGLTLNITSRKELEISVRKSEVKLQSILACINSGLVVVETSGEIIYANESAGVIMQRMKEKVERKHFASDVWGLVDKDGKPLPIDQIPLSIALTERRPVSNSTIGVLDINHKRKWLSVNAAPLFDHDGILQGAVASFTDITQERQAQHELRLVYDELNAILNASTDSTFFLDQDYRIRVFNKTGERIIKSIHGKQVKKGDSMLEYSDYGSVEDFKRNFWRAMNGELVMIERPIHFPTTSIWVQVQYLPVFSESGTIIGISFNATNITDRKNAERTLFESKQYFESLVNSQSSFLIRTDLPGNYLFANNRFTEKLGFAKETIAEKKFPSSLIDDDRFLYNEVTKLCLDSPGKVYPATLRVESIAKELLFIEWEFVAIQDESGQSIGLQAVGLDATDRIRYQLELEKVHSRLQIATQAASIGVWEWNIEIDEILWDQQTYEMAGYPLDEKITSASMESLIESNDLASLTEQISALTPAKPTIASQFRITHRSESSIRYIKTFAVGEFNKLGKLIKLIGVNYDITEQEISNERIKESEKRFRTMADSAPVIIYMTDQLGKATFLSQPWYDFTGTLPDTEPGHDWLNIVHPDDAEMATSTFLEAFQKKTSFTLAYRLRSKEGIYHWFSNTGIPRHLNTGEFLGYIGSCFDITERKQAEEALAQKSEFLEAILDTVDVGIIVCNEEGNITLHNRYTEKLYEFDTHPKAESIEEYLKHFYQNEGTSPIERTLTEGRVKEFEHLLNIGGKTKTVLANGKRLNYVDGRQSGAVVAVHDISKMKKIEESLLNLLREKEVLIKEIHHRIKNNLQFISSILYLKMKTVEDVEIQSFLEGTRQKIKSIALIHERLLQTETVDQIDSKDYLDALIVDIRNASTRRDSPITFNYEIESVSLKLDTAIYIGLIMNEIIANSIKHAFRDTEKGLISIVLTRMDSKLCLRVSDNGSPMDSSISPGPNGSFGMRLLDIFIHQLQGELVIERIECTTFVIQIPIK